MKNRLQALSLLDRALATMTDAELEALVATLPEDHVTALDQLAGARDGGFDEPAARTVALRAAVARGRLTGALEQITTVLTDPCLADFITALGDKSDHPSEDDLQGVLPDMITKHGLPTVRLTIAASIAGEAAASVMLSPRPEARRGGGSLPPPSRAAVVLSVKPTTRPARRKAAKERKQAEARARREQVAKAATGPGTTHAGAHAHAQRMRPERSAGRDTRRSWSSSHAFWSSPPANPVSAPVLPTTRWHGTMMLIGLRPFAAPTARALFGSPSACLLAVSSSSRCRGSSAAPPRRLLERRTHRIERYVELRRSPAKYSRNWVHREARGSGTVVVGIAGAACIAAAAPRAARRCPGRANVLPGHNTNRTPVAVAPMESTPTGVSRGFVVATRSVPAARRGSRRVRGSEVRHRGAPSRLEVAGARRGTRRVGWVDAAGVAGVAGVAAGSRLRHRWCSIRARGAPPLARAIAAAGDSVGAEALEGVAHRRGRWGGTRQDRRALASPRTARSTGRYPAAPPAGGAGRRGRHRRRAPRRRRRPRGTRR
ncbi:MAG: hypothetical protein R2713_09005 [Ilumatobacteraceae bacterium]